MAGRRSGASSGLLLLCAALAIGSASAVINLGAWELLGIQQNCWYVLPGWPLDAFLSPDALTAPCLALAHPQMPD